MEAFRSDPLFDVSGKTVLVTGASSGLGAVFAKALADRGARVVLAARRRERLEALASSIERDAGVSLVVECDVTRPEQIASMVEVSEARFGRIDVLINNAGVAADGGPRPERLPLDRFEHTVKVNLVGLWSCSQQVGIRMLRDGQGGSIINIASIAGLGGTQDFPPAYQATKAAVINLTRTLACSWGDRGVRVNAIAPGWFPSEMTADVLDVPLFAEWTKRMPLKRNGKPEELLGVLLLLASPASSFITGQTIVVDGGVTAMVGTQLDDELIQFFAETIPDGLGKRIMPD